MFNKFAIGVFTSLSLSATAMAQSAEAGLGAFNLVCSGIRTSENTGKKPYNNTYRVNLDTGEWCEMECKSILKIAKLEPNRIAFISKEEDTPRSHSFIWDRVDRVTGEHQRDIILKDVGIIIEDKGHCEKAAFSGFPTYQTKF